MRGVRHFFANQIEPLSLSGSTRTAEPGECVTHAFSCDTHIVTSVEKLHIGYNPVLLECGVHDKLHISAQTGGIFYFPWHRHQTEGTDGV